MRWNKPPSQSRLSLSLPHRTDTPPMSSLRNRLLPNRTPRTKSTYDIPRCFEPPGRDARWPPTARIARHTRRHERCTYVYLVSHPAKRSREMRPRCPPAARARARTRVRRKYRRDRVGACTASPFLPALPPTILLPAADGRYRLKIRSIPFSPPGRASRATSRLGPWDRGCPLCTRDTADM